MTSLWLKRGRESEDRRTGAAFETEQGKEPMVGRDLSSKASSTARGMELSLKHGQRVLFREETMGMTTNSNPAPISPLSTLLQPQKWPESHQLA